MRISSVFDGGNIVCLSAEEPGDIRLEIRHDHQSEFYQWFYFRLTGAAGQACVMHLTNAAGAAYPEGFKDYQAVASYDRETWFRVDTRFDGEVLRIHHQPEYNAVYYAYFAPYSQERHADMVAEALASPLVDLIPLTPTLDGRDLDLLVVGNPSHEPVWCIARQHPGETMAEWWMEGFLQKLLDEADPVSRALLSRYVFYVVPNMNPDGSFRGHLRTNAAGINLNREWQNPSMEKSPEVYAVREMMHQTGVSFFFDVHGDEGLPYNFIASSYGVKSWTPEREQLLDRYRANLCAVSPDFQTKFGYAPDPPGEAVMTKATNYVGETFGCPAMTLEMPFKDAADTPDPLEGWSPERCRHLADAVLTALHLTTR